MPAFGRSHYLVTCHVPVTGAWWYKTVVGDKIHSKSRESQ